MTTLSPGQSQNMKMQSLQGLDFVCTSETSEPWARERGFVAEAVVPQSGGGTLTQRRGGNLGSPWRRVESKRDGDGSSVRVVAVRLAPRQWPIARHSSNLANRCPLRVRSRHQAIV